MRLTADNPSEDIEAGVLARRRADRVPVGTGRRRHLPHDRFGRVGEAPDRLRLLVRAGPLMVRRSSSARGGFITPTGYLSTAHGLSIVTVKTGQARQLAIDGRAMQPAWSPSGCANRILGGARPERQRDIWTVAADGSDAVGGGVPVTQDSALDWSPTWSPDGRYLYFSSTRGGTMNLWRTRIDERSGRVLGEPEPITTPSRWSGCALVLARRHALAFASLDYRSTILRVPFDPVREAVVGRPSRSSRGHARSAITNCRPTASGSPLPRLACRRTCSSRASTAPNTGG